MNALLAAGEWLWAGVPLRFPGLQVALSEGGIGWVPMLMDRVDYVLDHVMVESGYAHADSTWPDTQAVVGRAFGGQPEPDLRKVAAGNAARLFRHPLPPVDDWRTAPGGP